MDNQLEIANVSNVVVEYLKERPVGAILINGKWGSGKTHFWKNHLEDLVKENKLIPVYVSLNGINSIKDMEQQTIVAFLARVRGKQAKFWNNVIGTALTGLNITTQKAIDSGLGDIIRGMGLSKIPMEKYVVCFDDLERCKLPIAESLGFINRFLEHQFLKTIIMADESEIPEKEVEEYNKKKEKVISRVLGFEVDIPEIITILSQTRKGHSPFEKLLKEHKNFITDFLQEYQVKNLRVLMFWTYILDRIAPEVCRILTTRDSLPMAAFKVFWQTIRTGVKAAVMLPVPSWEVVKKMYWSIRSSLPTRILSGSLAVIKIRSPLPRAPAVSYFTPLPSLTMASKKAKASAFCTTL